MNSVLLLIIGAVVFAFGYRFYSKLLAVKVFRLQDYSTGAEPPAHEGFTVRNRHLAFAHQFALVAGATTVTGSAIAVLWGWIPAFLWVVVGTVIAAGIYALGSVWLAFRRAGTSLADIAADLIGRRARLPFLLLALVLLVLLNAGLAWLTAEILRMVPTAVIPFWLLVGFAVALGVRTQRGGRAAFSLALAVAFASTLASVWLLGKIPLAFSGALNFDAYGRTFVSVDATALWMILIFVSTYFATKAAPSTLMQPRGYLTTILAGLFLLILIIGIIIQHPPLLAPDFHAVTDSPPVVPWMFVTLTSGALAGLYMLFAVGITAEQLPTEADARYVGYGTALANGFFALTVIAVCTAGFSDQQSWEQFYSSWTGVQSLPQLVALYIDGFAHFAGALALAPEFAGTFAAVVIAGLISVTVDGGMRALRQLLKEFGELYPFARLRNDRTLLLVTVGLPAALAFADGYGRGALLVWPLFGAWHQMFALAGFLLIGMALRHLQRSVLYLLVPGFFVLIVTTWALVAQLVVWWSAGSWLLIAGAASLLGMGGWLAWEAVQTYRQPVASVPDA
ncbi:MAG: carbon starvation CstA family protein [Acidiferrobacterales bacterium]